MKPEYFMKKRLFLLAFFFLPLFVFSQKAYDPIYYTGKTQNITANLMLAIGYIAACEIKTTDNKTKKTSTFLPVNGFADDEKKMKFYHHSKSSKKFSDYFILEGMEENYETPPTEIFGKYFFDGKVYEIVLSKL